MIRFHGIRPRRRIREGITRTRFDRERDGLGRITRVDELPCDRVALERMLRLLAKSRIARSVLVVQHDDNRTCLLVPRSRVRDRAAAARRQDHSQDHDIRRPSDCH
ncbi:MAG: hypothetical protein DMF86_03020 [Acidobacteria bacterium]|nr:MAG: hypothetical protein DMF86_03020 [Acidobacteriota bacterium]